jgi:hypothetical protein
MLLSIQKTTKKPLDQIDRKVPNLPAEQTNGHHDKPLAPIKRQLKSQQDFSQKFNNLFECWRLAILL